MKKRLFRSLLCCCIVLAALTAGVLAADGSTIPSQVVVSGTDVTKGGCWTVESDGTLTPGGDPTRPGSVAYDAVRGVLTLHEVQLQRPCIDESIGFHEDAAIFAQDGDLTLVLKGKNSVDGYMVANGIYVRDGDLTVDGDGEMAMTIIQWKSFRYGSYGLYSTQDIAIQGGTLNFAGAVESADCIYADNAVTVTGGTIILGVWDHADGIHTNHLTVDGGAVNVADAGDGGRISGINSLVIRSGSVRLDGAALYSAENLTVQGGTVTVNDGRLYGRGTVTVEGSTLTVPAGAAADLLTVSAIGPDAVIQNDGTLKLPGELAPDGSAVRALGIQGNGNVFVPTAEWEYLYKNDGTLLETQLPFDDVSDGDWFYEDVKTACTTGLMSGVGDRRFAPEEPASRAMVVTILWRQAGSPQVNYAMQFDDVPKDAWYTEAVRWAVSERIVSGYDDRTFGPGDPVTREQMAVLLYRCAEKAGLDTASQGQELETFGDRDRVSAYAREAVAWAVRTKLLGGVRADTLAPQGQTTRAQAAAILLRYGRLGNG